MGWLLPDTIDFFRELELNNDREWFASNKVRYETSVKRPMETLADELIQRLKTIDPAISMTGKEALFRIYRDVRFSKDKLPYKTHAGMAITRGGRSDFSVTGLYFEVGPREMGVAGGYYFLEPEKVRAMRRYLAENLDELESRLSEPWFKRLYGTIEGDRNKKLPPEFRAAAERQPIMLNKQFYYWAPYDAEEALRDDLPDFIFEHYRAALPMNAFLSQAFLATENDSR
jgi:uncharacterized protein (TIGR02453 family)